MNVIVSLLAAATPVQNAPGWAKILASPLLPLGIAVLFMFTFFNRNTGKEKKAREEMLKQLKRGDRVQTIGGILGTVLRAEDTRVEVKVDETNNTKIWFARSAIQRVVEQEKVEAAPVGQTFLSVTGGGTPLAVSSPSNERRVHRS